MVIDLLPFLLPENTKKEVFKIKNGNFRTPGATKKPSTNAGLMNVVFCCFKRGDAVILLITGQNLIAGQVLVIRF